MSLFPNYQFTQNQDRKLSFDKINNLNYNNYIVNNNSNSSSNNNINESRFLNNDHFYYNNQDHLLEKLDQRLDSLVSFLNENDNTTSVNPTTLRFINSPNHEFYNSFPESPLSNGDVLSRRNSIDPSYLLPRQRQNEIITTSNLLPAANRQQTNSFIKNNNVENYVYSSAPNSSQGSTQSHAISPDSIFSSPNELPFENNESTNDIILHNNANTNTSVSISSSESDLELFKSWKRLNEQIKQSITDSEQPREHAVHSHRRRHYSTGSIEKIKYDCKICGKKFKRPSSLSTHMNIHTGKKPYRCPHISCTKSFNAKSNMLRHYKLHFKLNTGQYILPNGEIISGKPTTRQLFGKE